MENLVNCYSERLQWEKNHPLWVESNLYLTNLPLKRYTPELRLWDLNLKPLSLLQIYLQVTFRKVSKFCSLYFTFKIYSLSLNSLIMMCLGSLWFLSYLEFIEWLECLDKFGIFLTTVSLNIHSVPFFVFWELHCAYVGTLDDVLLISEALFILLHSLLFLYLRQDNLHWPIFKFTGSFFCWL